MSEEHQNHRSADDYRKMSIFELVRDLGKKIGLRVEGDSSENARYFAEPLPGEDPEIEISQRKASMIMDQALAEGCYQPTHDNRPLRKEVAEYVIPTNFKY